MCTKYTASRFFARIDRNFNKMFGTDYIFTSAPDGAYITKDTYRAFFLPGVSILTTGGSNAKSTSSIRQIFRNAADHNSVFSVSRVPGVLQRRFNKDLPLIRFDLPGDDARPVYINKQFLNIFPAATRFRFDPDVKAADIRPVIAELPDDSGEYIPVALVMPMRVLPQYFIPEESGC